MFTIFFKIQMISSFLNSKYISSLLESANMDNSKPDVNTILLLFFHLYIFLKTLPHTTTKESRDLSNI